MYEFSNIQRTKHLVPFLVLLVSLSNQVTCGRILIITQAPFYSHGSVMRGLGLALHKRGHEIVMITSFPTKNLSLINYTEIDFSENYDRSLNFKFHDESVYSHGVFYVARVLNIPVIGITTLDFHAHQSYMWGIPLLPSHLSHWEFDGLIEPNMSLSLKVRNFIYTMLVLRDWYNFEVEQVHDLVKSYLGNNTPSFFELRRNISLFLVNHDLLLGFAKPVTPNVIYFNGFHIMENPPPLPSDMDEFLRKAHDGFIYMSLGTIVSSSLLSDNAIRSIFNVFSRLPYKILWKFETNDALPKHPNIFTSKWIPQQSVLARPNTKLFVYQGGLQSTEEAIHYGVPIVGIPIFIDQIFRIKKLVSHGVGRMLEFNKYDEETFREAVNDVLNNERYKTKMLKLRELMNDKPYDSKNHTLWWIEYVMRRKEVPHLHFSGADDPWYQRYDIDVIAFLSIISFTIIIISIIIFVQILQWSCRFKYAKKWNKID
ncbi:UDP-glycosyltransferase UGT5-like isoform X2 [Osmia bicornis bicornis]|uniref:UDP-glycosyltransferase UGT5-like isoform X2 n=1 Tax=Osmia bicornis bicornis TaxID=1437191 RepID=UPI001EAF1C37|nr:UDP-glycosyltransferase UGT5-like isoform X2 [Osmia bicornis bicornis]